MIIYLEMINAPEERHKFEVLYRAYRRMMFYIANRILNNEQDAEDAVHSAFVYIAENIQKIDEPMCPKTRGYINFLNIFCDVHKGRMNRVLCILFVV